MYRGLRVCALVCVLVDFILDNQEAVRKLLQYKCEIKQRDISFKTALQLAELHGHTKIVGLLRR